MKARLPAAIPYDLAIGASSVEDLPYLSDVYQYDAAGATGAVVGGTVQLLETIYDSAGGTGSISGGTVQPSDVIYD
jgi:hypothetical protein